MLTVRSGHPTKLQRVLWLARWHLWQAQRADLEVRAVDERLGASRQALADDPLTETTLVSYRGASLERAARHRDSYLRLRAQGQSDNRTTADDRQNDQATYGDSCGETKDEREPVHAPSP